MLLLLAELVLSALLALDGSAEAVAVHGGEGTVDEVGARPALVGKGVDTLVALRALDALHVAEHGLVTAEGAREAVGIEGGKVEAGKGHELPHEAELAEVAAEGAHLGIGHAACVPVERRREVVREVGLLTRAVHALDALGESLGILEDRLGGLGPHDVGVRSEVAHAVAAHIDTRAEHEVALAGAGKLPAPEGLGAAKKLAGEGAGVLVGDAGELGVLGVPLGDFLLGSVVLLEGLKNGGVEGHHGVVLLPGGHVGGGLGVAVRAGLGVGGTHDEHVVARVLVGLDELGGLSVGTGDDDGLGAHDVALETGGHEAIDVLAGGHENLAAHVAALLGAVALILEVDASRTSINHELGQAHDGGHATVAGITVGNDGTKVVNGVLEVTGSPLSLKLLAVMELLGLEQALNVLGDSVHGVVSKIGTRLHHRGMVGGRLPAGNVDGLGEANHLGDLGIVEAAEGHRGAALLTEVADKLEQLGSSERGSGAGPLDGATELGHVLRSVVTEGAAETVRGHPSGDLLDAGIMGEHVAGTLGSGADTVRCPHSASRGGSKAGSLGISEARGGHVEGRAGGRLSTRPAVLGLRKRGSRGVEAPREPAAGSSSALFAHRKHGWHLGFS
mmetsp:Transcript_82936/g.222482  ORF Transcript_82936/g.222482 Transcript_82936/m.222482 type:complete len:618 (-) Transcript_82936:32-1885(-)